MQTTSNTTAPSVSTTPASDKKDGIILGKFNGAFRVFAANWFGLLVFYGLTKKQSHKIAFDAMSALGTAMAQDSELYAKVSKANKNGDGSFKIGGKSGLTQHSNAMKVIRVCQLLEAIREEKLTQKPCKLNDMEQFLSEELSTYVSDCEQWKVTIVTE